MKLLCIGQGYFFQIVNPDIAFDLQNKSRTRLNLNKKTLGKILRGKLMNNNHIPVMLRRG